jgi:lysozyme
MKFSNYNFLKRWEGLRLEAYKDGGGVWTIGYGHTKGVKPGDTITLEEAKQLLDADLLIYEKAVNSGVKRPITQNQYDAFVSLCYNIGTNGFQGSTALRRFNAGDIDGAAEALTWWNKDNGKVIQGLVNRRYAEKELFLTPDTIVPVSTIELQIEAALREYTKRIMEIVSNDT